MLDVNLRIFLWWPNIESNCLLSEFLISSSNIHNFSSTFTFPELYNDYSSAWAVYSEIFMLFASKAIKKIFLNSHPTFLKIRAWKELDFLFFLSDNCHLCQKPSIVVMTIYACLVIDLTSTEVLKQLYQKKYFHLLHL